MNEISIILICYAINKGWPGRLIQVIADWGEKMAGFGLFSRRSLPDYAVTEISQYVWWGSFSPLWAKGS
ncbi:hypothetical protein ACNKHK_20790 [Shigella flexneri]